MDVNFTLWSLKEVFEKIPFDLPTTESVEIDFSEIAVPYYVKNTFKVLIIYDDSLPHEASCSIYSPKHVVTVIFIMKKRYETTLAAWLANSDAKDLKPSCFRRELYCHETCHLVAIIRAYPSNRSSLVREDFIAKINEKFTKSLKTAEDIGALVISMEKNGESPSVFDKEHFRYGNDSLNYFELYSELMFSYDKMVEAAQNLCASTGGNKPVTYTDVERETLVSADFFKIFPEKLTALKEMLVAEMSHEF